MAAGLSASQIEEFKARGVLVVEGVLSDAQVDEALLGLETALLARGVCPDQPSSMRNLAALSSTNGAGGVLDLFYDDWKMRLVEHESILQIMLDLFAHTFATCEGDFAHPYGEFDATKAYAYIDRVCYRVPDTVSIACGSRKRPLQRGLAPHLDCCPHLLYAEPSRTKWKPIQAFVSLTATLDHDEGGFECCPGHHRRFADWAKLRPGTPSSAAPVCVGEFTPIRAAEDADVLARFEHIPCGRGALVVWDNRLPHANARCNRSTVTRQVVYIGQSTVPRSRGRVSLSSHVLHRDLTPC